MLGGAWKTRGREEVGCVIWHREMRWRGGGAEEVCVYVCVFVCVRACQGFLLH